MNSSSNPAVALLPRECVRDLALLAQERGLLLLSDEVYRVFRYDQPFASPAEFNEDVLVFDGFSKAYGMTGWRLGFPTGRIGFRRRCSARKRFRGRGDPQ